MLRFSVLKKKRKFLNEKDFDILHRPAVQTVERLGDRSLRRWQKNTSKTKMQKSMFDVLICRAKPKLDFQSLSFFDLFDLQIQMQKLMLLFSGPSDLHTQNQKCNFCFFHLGRALTFVNLAGSETQSTASSGKKSSGKAKSMRIFHE